MSHVPESKKKVVRLNHFLEHKQKSTRFAAITCYDNAFARLIDESSIEMVLVGDSVGNVVLGYENTLPVTMDEMVHHCRAVARGLRRPFLVADMPFGSYQVNSEEALNNAVKLVKFGGAHAVKLEGGAEICGAVASIVRAGIPVLGHLGLTPQSIHALGGYKVQAKHVEARGRLLDDVKALEEAGAFGVVLELIPSSLAKEVTVKTNMVTIGIGAGPACDGQILVLHDMLGFQPNFRPKFLKTYANLSDVIGKALSTYEEEVKDGLYPGAEHSFE